MLAFRILFEDEWLLAIDKPPGFHSHAPENKSIRVNPRWNGLQILERQLGRKLFPLHRLDRASSGILLHSKDREWNSRWQELFARQQVEKTYFCVVRGEWTGITLIDDPLQDAMGGAREAKTLAEERISFSLPIGTEGKSRAFTLVRAQPFTGRFHQIRRHLTHKGCPLLGDSRHGDKHLNRACAERLDLQRLFLRCM